MNRNIQALLEAYYASLPSAFSLKVFANARFSSPNRHKNPDQPTKARQQASQLQENKIEKQEVSNKAKTKVTKNLDLLKKPRKNKKYSPKGTLVRPKTKNHQKSKTREENLHKKQEQAPSRLRKHLPIRAIHRSHPNASNCFFFFLNVFFCFCFRLFFRGFLLFFVVFLPFRGQRSGTLKGEPSETEMLKRSSFSADLLRNRTNPGICQFSIPTALFAMSHKSQKHIIEFPAAACQL